MTSPNHKPLLDALAQLGELSPDIRFGQLLANLGLLTEDRTEHTLWDVDDEELLSVMEGHRRELASRSRQESTVR